mmetsp:Transcript_12330/g.14754  ORF Transcript_12330/g.14754 Transcript_12330/m.14754 type:complete len:332 (+) Transcript_12330:166-1161(+)
MVDRGLQSEIRSTYYVLVSELSYGKLLVVDTHHVRFTIVDTDTWDDEEIGKITTPALPDETAAKDFCRERVEEVCETLEDQCYILFDKQRGEHPKMLFKLKKECGLNTYLVCDFTTKTSLYHTIDTVVKGRQDNLKPTAVWREEGDMVVREIENGEEERLCNFHLKSSELNLNSFVNLGSLVMWTKPFSVIKNDYVVSKDTLFTRDSFKSVVSRAVLRSPERVNPAALPAFDKENHPPQTGSPPSASSDEQRAPIDFTKAVALSYDYDVYQAFPESLQLRLGVSGIYWITKDAKRRKLSLTPQAREIIRNTGGKKLLKEYLSQEPSFPEDY